MRSRSKIFVAWGLWLMLLVLLVYLAKGPFFTIRHTKCVNVAGGSCPEVFDAEIRKVIGQSTLFYDPAPLIRKLHQALPASGEVNATITLPDTATLSMSSQPLIANLKVATNGGALLVGQDNRIVAEVPEADPHLPVVYAASGTVWRAGDTLTDPTLHFTLALITEINARALPSTQLTIRSSQEILAALPEGRTAVFSSLENLTRQVTSLQLILDKATMTSDTKVIDVRFEKPVLKPS